MIFIIMYHTWTPTLLIGNSVAAIFCLDDISRNILRSFSDVAFSILFKSA